ncbi:MAG TPA: hypothetical protein ENL42_04115 [Thermoplasmatales archaeon]|nr:hypothetical protein [Thermoplasmatales archaeon]
MKDWKILGILAIVGMFVMPMMPATKAIHPVLPPCENEGDIVLADGSRIPDLPKWDHAQIYVGDGNNYVEVPVWWGNKACIEADPHTEEWPGGFVPPNLLPRWRLKQLEDNYGKIEWTNLQQTYWDYYNAGFTPAEKQHVAIAYYKVVDLEPTKLNTLRYWVTRFVYDRLTDPDDDGIEEHPEYRFDLISYWKDDTKQESGSSERAQRYYCSELVWTAYRHASRTRIGYTIDLDPDSHKVTPLELAESGWTQCYWQYGTPW